MYDFALLIIVIMLFLLCLLENVRFFYFHRDQGDNQRIVQDLTSELRRVVRKCNHDPNNSSALFPLETAILNQGILPLVLQPQNPKPQPPKHFALRRKPKAAALRADLLLRAQDALTNNKKVCLPGQ